MTVLLDMETDDSDTPATRPETHKAGQSPRGGGGGGGEREET